MPSGDKIEAHFCSPKMASHVHFQCVGLLVAHRAAILWGHVGARAGLLASESGLGGLGRGVGGLVGLGVVPGLQGCKTTWGKTHCKRSRRCQLHFHDLSVFKVTRTEVITLPSLTIVQYDHNHFLVCLFYDLPLFLCKQETFNNSRRASLQLQVYGWSDAQ